MNRDRATYGSIEAKYDEWVEIVASKPAVAPAELPAQRPYTPEPEHDDMAKTIYAGIGFGIAALLLLLAVWAFVVAAKWTDLERAGAATGYTLVGLFLVLSGVGGIIATWNHNFRVLARGGGGSH